jgi:16S rRNA processing protein RimM
MTAEELTKQPWVWLARIRRVQGRKGEVLADLLTDFPEKFAERRQLWLLSAAGLPGESARKIQLKNSWLHKGNIVLHFADVDSINEAEKLRDLVVAVPWAERIPLGEDEVYIGDLIGCVLVDVSGEAAVDIGEIEGVDRDAGPIELLVVRAPGVREEILVPFAKAYLRRIDMEGRRVEMALPDGLVDVQLSGKQQDPDEPQASSDS